MKFGYFCNPWNIGHKRDYGDIPERSARARAVLRTGRLRQLLARRAPLQHLGPGDAAQSADHGRGTSAARTERIRIGLAAAIITFWHPLRLAEDIALLDQLCDGRLEFGVGRGNYGLEGLNLNPKADPNNPADNFGVFADTINIVKEALSKSRFRYDGAKYTIPYPGLQDRPGAPGQSPRLRGPGDRGAPVHLDLPQAPPDSVSSVVAGGRLTELHRVRREERSRNHHVAPTGRSVARAMRLVPGECRQRGGRAAIRRAHRDQPGCPHRVEPRGGPPHRREVGDGCAELQQLARAPRIFLRPGETFAPGQEDALKKELPFEFVDERSLIFGPPEYAVEKFTELRDELNLEQVNMKMGWPGMGQRDILRSLELFAERVLPELRRGEPAESASAAVETGAAA